MGRLSSVLLKALCVFLLALVALSVVGTVVGIALSVLATLLSLVVTVAVLGVFALAVVGLVSLFGGDSDATAETDTPRHEPQSDPEERLRSRYVDGELDDAEFERELERVLEPDERRGRRETDPTAARDASNDRSRLRDR